MRITHFSEKTRTSLSNTSRLHETQKCKELSTVVLLWRFLASACDRILFCSSLCVQVVIQLADRERFKKVDCNMHLMPRILTLVAPRCRHSSWAPPIILDNIQ